MITWLLVYQREGHKKTIINVKTKRTMRSNLLLPIMRFEAYLWLKKEVPLSSIEIF